MGSRGGWLPWGGAGRLQPLLRHAFGTPVVTCANSERLGLGGRQGRHVYTRLGGARWPGWLHQAHAPCSLEGMFRETGSEPQWQACCVNRAQHGQGLHMTEPG